MKIFYSILALTLLTPVTALSINTHQRAHSALYNKQLEYKCIEEHRDKTNDELNACIKEKRGASVIRINNVFSDTDKE